MGGRGRGHKRKGDTRVLKRDFKKSRDNVWDEMKPGDMVGVDWRMRLVRGHVDRPTLPLV